MKIEHKKAVKAFKQPNGIIEYHITNVESWDDFESLAKFIVKEFSAEIIDKLDGICSRTWKIQIGNEEFVLKHHDDIGNYFYLDRISGNDALMKKIADSLDSKLSNLE